MYQLIVYMRKWTMLLLITNENVNNIHSYIVENKVCHKILTKKAGEFCEMPTEHLVWD